MKKIYLLLAVLFLGSPAFAQIALSGKDSDKPVEITSDSLKVIQTDKIAVFEGKVEAIQGAMNLKSDKMTVYYSGNDKKKGKAGSGNAVSKIIVEGNVFLRTAAETAESEKGTYDVDKALVTLTGNVILTKGSNVIKGNKLVYEMNSGKSQLFGSTAKDGKPGRVKGLFVPNKQ